MLGPFLSIVWLCICLTKCCNCFVRSCRLNLASRTCSPYDFSPGLRGSFILRRTFFSRRSEAASWSPRTVRGPSRSQSQRTKDRLTSNTNLDGRNRARLIAESLARVIPAIRITSVRWRSYLPLKHRISSS